MLRDTGRILQMSYGHVDRLCKMVPNHPTDPWTLPRALNGVSEFKREYDNDDEVQRLIDLAMQLEGFPRNTSTHAAGVVIGDRPLAQLVPLYRDPRSDMPVTQFDMKTVEDTGLVKFDFLGLKTLSVLRKAVDLLERRGIAIDLDALEWDDPKVYDLLKRGDTVGVFQLESEGMRRTLSAVKPTKFEDIIALVSLYRPGPMDNIPLFGKRKNGEAEIEYPHPKLEGILAETYGIFVYQEQVMQAAQILAGYSLGDADLLRRAMGKKIQAEMDAQRQRFVDGCKEVSGIERAQGQRAVRLDRQVRRLRLQQVARRRLCAAQLPDGLAQDALPGRILRRLDVLRHAPVGQAGGVRRRPAAQRQGRCSGPTSTESKPNSPSSRPRPATRCAMASPGINNVGEKAMDAVVEERAQGRAVRKPRGRVPAHAARGDEPPPARRAGRGRGVRLPRAQPAHDPRQRRPAARRWPMPRCASAKAASTGCSAARTTRSPRCGWPRPSRGPAPSRWPPSARTSASTSPPIRSSNSARSASANGARTYASLMEAGVPGGGRMPAVMAAMVEGVTKGRTRRGGEFIRADFSDNSGQFSAACFEEALVDSFQRWAAEGTCVLLNVELDAPSPDEPPRVTVRGARPLAEVEARCAHAADARCPHRRSTDRVAPGAERRRGRPRRGARPPAYRRSGRAGRSPRARFRPRRRTGRPPRA